MGLCASKNVNGAGGKPDAPADQPHSHKDIQASHDTRNTVNSSPDATTTANHRDSRGELSSSISARSRTSSNRNGSTTSTGLQQRQGNGDTEEHVPRSPNSEEGKSKKKFGKKAHSSKQLAHHRDSLTLHVRKVRVRATSDAADTSKGLPSTKSFSGQGSSAFSQSQAGSASEQVNKTSFLRAHTMPSLPVKSVRRIHSSPQNAQSSAMEDTVTTETEQETTRGYSTASVSTQAEASVPHTAWTTSMEPVECADSYGGT